MHQFGKHHKLDWVVLKKTEEKMTSGKPNHVVKIILVSLFTGSYIRNLIWSHLSERFCCRERDGKTDVIPNRKTEFVSSEVMLSIIKSCTKLIISVHDHSGA